MVETRKKMKELVLYSFIAISILTSFYIRPLMKGLDAIYSKPVASAIQNVCNEDKNAKWATLGLGITLPAYNVACGAPTINSLNVYPNMELWEKLGSGFPRQIDGVVAQSDELALGTLQFLQRNGFRVPQQVKIIGVDNSPFCGLLETPLSSVDQNIYEVGLTASRQLMKLIRGEEIGNVLIAPMLAVRASSSDSNDITIKP